MEPKAKRPWHGKRWGTTPPTGEKGEEIRPPGETMLASRCRFTVREGPRHDIKLLESTWDHIVVVRPKPNRLRQRLFAGKGYVGQITAQAVRQRGYAAHVQQRGEEVRSGRQGRRARRWVVERTSFVVQPVPQTPGAIREDGGQFRGLGATRRSLDLLANVLNSL